MDSLRNVVIVGSGPAGYTAAIYAARAGLNPLLLAGWTPGGALMNTTEVENFPGFASGIQGPALMEEMLEQGKRFGAEVLEEEAEDLALTAGGTFALALTDESTVEAKAVILAMGAQHRHLGIPGEEALGGLGVSYCATCDATFFSQQRVAVVGGGDSAVEEATFAARFASEVTLIHRGERLRASAAMQERLGKTPNLKVLYSTEVTEALGEGRLRGVRLRNNKTEEEGLLETEGLFISIGHDPRSSLCEDLVDLKEGGYVKTLEETTATRTPGLFACGDLVDSRYRQAITAAGSGCAAALDAQRYLEELQ